MPHRILNKTSQQNLAHEGQNKILIKKKLYISNIYKKSISYAFPTQITKTKKKSTQKKEHANATASKSVYLDLEILETQGSYFAMGMEDVEGV